MRNAFAEDYMHLMTIHTRNVNGEEESCPVEGSRDSPFLALPTFIVRSKFACQRIPVLISWY